jgi:hypothetical protein
MNDWQEPLLGLPEDGSWSREVHLDALKRKGVRGRCEACGRDVWGAGDRLLLLQAIDASGGITPGRGVEVVPVYCRHCGLLHLHAASLLLRD